MGRKWLAVGIILLFVGTCVNSSTTQNTEEQSSRGNWLYVGGSGPENYTKIQDAIDDSQDGDTIYVYEGVYNETLVIPTAIGLFGESKNTTQITAKIPPNDALIAISSSNVTISGFTFYGFDSKYSVILKDTYHYPENRNLTISDNIFNGTFSTGISFYWWDFCTIAQNTFLSTYAFGMFLGAMSNCSIINNQLLSPQKNQCGLYLSDMSHCVISNNSIISCIYAITLESTGDTVLSYNYFYNNTRTILMEEGSYNNIILSNSLDNRPQKINPPLESIGIIISDFSAGIQVEKNMIRHCNIGIMIEDSLKITVSMNTFLNNNIHARFYNKYLPDTIWSQNYWGRTRILPKPIFGMGNTYAILPRMIQFDWHPAQGPYDIPGMT
jgi:parallel beta-helix repeat protein